jgi:predicted RNA-binding Zn-ribbon protein involved in translation (DUF1610 family)
VSPAATVVARWTTRPATTTTPVVCDECGEVLEPGMTRCPQCRQAAPLPPTGMLAVVVETTRGDKRLVVAERTPGGGWAATRTMPATPAVVRAVARQDHTRGGAA